MTLLRGLAVMCGIFGFLLAGSVSAQTWTMTFDDEFTGPNIDQTKWNLHTTDSQTTADVFAYLPDALSILPGGGLQIQGNNRTYCGHSYTSGAMTTYGKFSQTYGYFEMKAKLPAGQGLWPAWWMMPLYKTWPPEIDIMENLGKDPATIYTTLHYPPGNNALGQAFTVTGTSNFSQSYHTYGVAWRPQSLVFYVDGTSVYTVTGTNVPSQPMYLIVNMAMGGSWGGAVGALQWPVEMDVAYVHAYQYNGMPAGTSPPFYWTTPTLSTPSQSATDNILVNAGDTITINSSMITGTAAKTKDDVTLFILDYNGNTMDTQQFFSEMVNGSLVFSSTYTTPVDIPANSTLPLVSATYTVSGTLAAGTYSIAFYDGTGIELSSAAEFRIGPLSPMITSALTNTGTAGTAFSYQIAATNSPTSYSATGLPAGLSVNTSTGVITGTASTSGTSGVTIKAINTSGSDTDILTLALKPAPQLVSISVSPAIATVLTGSTQQFIASATDSYANVYTPSVTWSVNGGGSISASGLFSGGSITGGPYTITAANAGISGTASVTVTNVSLQITPPTPAVFNPATGHYEQTLTVTNQSLTTTGGFQITVTNVPAGVSVINGTYNAGTNTWTANFNPVLGIGQNTSVLISYGGASGGFNPSMAVVAAPVNFPAADPNFATAAYSPLLNSVTGNATVSFRAVPGRSYEVQYSSDLNTWSVATGPILAMNSLVQWVDDGTTTGSVPQGARKRFYRVVDSVPLVSMSVTPDSFTLLSGASLQFSASAKDAAGNMISPSLLTWSMISGGGSINSNGLYTASPSGPLSVQAASSGISDAATGDVVLNLSTTPFSPVLGESSTGTQTIVNSNAGLQLQGNMWVATPFPYTITPKTIMEFDFSATTSTSKIYAVGLATSKTFVYATYNLELFEVAGTVSYFGYQAFHNYSFTNGGTTHYTIPVGAYYTGPVSYLVMVAQDASNAANATYSNFEIYEGP